jgi:hypothetical protein
MLLATKVRKLAASLFLLLAFGVFSASFAQTGKVESIGPLTDASVPDALKAALQPKGSRLVFDDGKAAGEIWLRKAAPASDRKDPEALYPQLTESELVGVISFASAATDFRGQAIRPGFYSLRYESLPSNGDHLGVAPAPDFVLAVPAAADSNPTAKYDFDELVALSRKTTGTKHPAPLSMVQAGSAPGLAKDDQDHWVFTGNLSLSNGSELPVGIIVKGTAPQ